MLRVTFTADALGPFRSPSRGQSARCIEEKERRNDRARRKWGRTRERGTNRTGKNARPRGTKIVKRRGARRERRSVTCAVHTSEERSCSWIRRRSLETISRDASRVDDCRRRGVCTSLTRILGVLVSFAVLLTVVFRPRTRYEEAASSDGDGWPTTS